MRPSSAIRERTALGLAIALLALAAGCGSKDEGVEGDGPSVQCNEAPRGQIDPDTLIGLPLAKAKAKARMAGCSVRVVVRDGELLFVTDNIRTDRINVETTMGTVTEIVEIG